MLPAFCANADVPELLAVRPEPPLATDAVEGLPPVDTLPEAPATDVAPAEPVLTAAVEMKGLMLLPPIALARSKLNAPVALCIEIDAAGLFESTALPAAAA
jgi:hypothetical protein